MAEVEKGLQTLLLKFILRSQSMILPLSGFKDTEEHIGESRQHEDAWERKDSLSMEPRRVKPSFRIP